MVCRITKTGGYINASINDVQNGSRIRLDKAHRLCQARSRRSDRLYITGYQGYPVDSGCVGPIKLYKR